MVIFFLKGLKNATTTTNSLKMPVWKVHKNIQGGKGHRNRRAGKETRVLDRSGLNVTRQTEQGTPRRQGSGKQAGKVTLLCHPPKRILGQRTCLQRDQTGSNSSLFHQPFLIVGRLGNDNFPVSTKPWHKSVTVT